MSGTVADRRSSFAERTGLEWWSAAHFTFGLVYLGIVPVLIPAYVLSVTDSASASPRC